MLDLKSIREAREQLANAHKESRKDDCPKCGNSVYYTSPYDQLIAYRNEWACFPCTCARFGVTPDEVIRDGLKEFFHD